MNRSLRTLLSSLGSMNRRKRNIGRSCDKRKMGETKSKRREEKHRGKGINSRKVPRVKVRR